MPSSPHDVPALPILLPLAVVAVAVMAWRLWRRGASTVPRLVAVVTACAYAAGVLNEVFFPFAVHLGADGNDVPWYVYVQPIPLVTADPIGVVLNVALFVPFGALLPLLTRRRIRATLLTAALASLSIEILQLVGDVTVSTGRVADIDDVIGNTVGALLGYALFRVVARLAPVARFAAAAAWPSAPTAGGQSAAGASNARVSATTRSWKAGSLTSDEPRIGRPFSS